MSTLPNALRPGKKRKRAPAPHQPPQAEPAKGALKIDFPQPGEAVTSAEYTLRISADASQGIEVSIDDSPWKPCRYSVGHGWYDWSGYGNGVHKVQARARDSAGEILAVESRQVTVRGLR